ncbi:MAG TPA: ribosomal-processing cysteine protease Prp [Candidatus Atribacteria bacterium]|nr:ribosomal-processing cysteine protease Prp [Candidatus Atribacteria bacterium]HPT77664.1 ribosomal-processing cysteine protease Prp [Candidatus Atribacteria bacterium]
MIDIIIERDSKAFIRRFTVKGHAGYDEAGKDIVCAAVSAVAQTAVLGLIEVAHARPLYKQKDGFLSCELPDDIAEESRVAAGAILDTMAAGLKSIGYDYKDFISIIEREVE